MIRTRSSASPINIGNRKGELSTEQIVMIIILIVSFVVILYFFFRLNLGATTNADICHNSVALRAQSAKLVGQLQCKTDYVCITGGGKCANMVPTITTNVDASNKNATMKAIADQMSNCWYEFGEGKLNYGTTGIFGSGGCSICSVVGFDNSVLSHSGITYGDFYTYLQNTPKDSSQTYMQYLYGVSDIGTLENQYPVLRDNLNNNIISNSQYTISTGFNTGVGWGIFGGNGNQPVSYVTQSQLSSELKCSNFITQAS